jgi:hypothetical protein
MCRKVTFQDEIIYSSAVRIAVVRIFCGTAALFSFALLLRKVSYVAHF